MPNCIHIVSQGEQFQLSEIDFSTQEPKTAAQDDNYGTNSVKHADLQDYLL